eukprot:GEMP01085179.1.p1 GENE.GEMP01085179.1~~GEMP01085179.1.p1  ORF type:complete len:199 (+),score=41.76 GEMP01085179.1:84-680(+)
MFSLFQGLWRWLSYKEEKKLIILGVDNAGKSTILEQYKSIFGAKAMDLSKIPPTIGLNIARVQVGNIIAIIWDVGGGASMRSIWRNYFPDIEGVLFVVDSADPSRFQESMSVLEQVLAAPELRPDVPVLIFANKRDLEDAVPMDDMHKTFHRERLADKRPFHLLPCSGLNKINLEAGLQWLLSEMPAPEWGLVKRNSF